jgi:hypothetical protein
MFRSVVSLLLLGLAVSLAKGAEAPGQFYINRTSVSDAMVNHLHFINEGEFTAIGSLPWDARSVLTFTNRGEMFGLPGFRFENVDPVFGIRSPSAVFFNSPNGVIEAADTGGTVITFIDDAGGGEGGTIVLPGIGSFLKINALNVTNRGIIAVGANGLIQLHGQNVDLSAGALIVGDLFDPLSAGNFADGFPIRTNEFFPAAGIHDTGWGIGTDTNAIAQGVIGSVNPTDIGTMNPPPRTTNAFGGFTVAGFRLDEAMTWVREEVIDETNEVVQVIAVQTSDPNIGVFASFIDETFPPPNSGAGYLTAAIELRVPSTDFATLTRVTNSLYVLDQLGAQTNRELTTNIVARTFRPGNFIVHRDFPNVYGGQPASTNIREDLFTVHLATAGTNVIQQPYLSDIVTNEWSTYRFDVESTATRLPNIPGLSLTNLGGRVEINANELKLANTRIRGEGYVNLAARNATTSLSNIVDSPLVTINFGTALNESELTVNEFIPDRVERFTGSAWAYGAIFTNNFEFYTTNAPTDPADTNIVIVTNTTQVRFQLTLLDARNLQTTVETLIEDLRLTSTNNGSAIVYNEDLDIRHFLELRANEVTLTEGSRIATGPGVGLSYTNLHNISVITNLGTIQAVELADLRRSETEPYARFVNHGDIGAYGAEIWADYFENTGSIVTFANIDIRASTLRIDSGAFLTFGDGDIRLRGDVVKFSNWQAEAGGRLVLDASQTLTDGGVTSPNFIAVSEGFEMTSRRPTGDLLGTTIESSAATFQFIDHIWGGEDRGASAAGYANNLALGGLVLTGGVNSVWQFLPAHENAAIYIDVLTVTNGAIATSLAAFTNSFILGMNVYYADVVSTNPAITAQSINRIFGPNAPFNLIWVPGFAGPNSAVDVPLSANGPVSQMNRSLRESLLVDSDGDGIPNGRDAFPLSATAGGERDVQLVGVKHSASSGVSFSVAGPQTANYIIERAESLSSPRWQPVAGVLTNDPATSLKTFTDKIDQGSKQGYYRVRIAP